MRLDKEIIDIFNSKNSCLAKLFVCCSCADIALISHFRSVICTPCTLHSTFVLRANCTGHLYSVHTAQYICTPCTLHSTFVLRAHCTVHLYSVHTAQYICTLCTLHSKFVLRAQFTGTPCTLHSKFVLCAQYICTPCTMHVHFTLFTVHSTFVHRAHCTVQVGPKIEIDEAKIEIDEEE